MKDIEYFPINVEKTDWQTSSDAITRIRREVFIEEQEVPEALELDGLDNDATHWLVFSDDENPIATARLLGDGRIGRMAVQTPFRNKGVGSAMLRKIIKHAVAQNMGELMLSAQQHAIEFYESFGFKPVGDAHEEASIAHQMMQLSLALENQRYRRENQSAWMQDEKRQREPLENSEDFYNAALQLVQQAHKHIRIFSQSLLPDLYNDQHLCEELFGFAISKPSAHIQVLVRDIEPLAQNSHQLHELSLRLPSHIEIRKLNEESTTPHLEFMLADKLGVLYQQDTRRLHGYMVQHAPLEAAELADQFDQLWLSGKPDPALRRLHI